MQVKRLLHLYLSQCLCILHFTQTFESSTALFKAYFYLSKINVWLKQKVRIQKP